VSLNDYLTILRCILSGGNSTEIASFGVVYGDLRTLLLYVYRSQTAFYVLP
jgi:hypothetical protein